jgi:rhodanese-related sulfurtransferase
LAKALADLVRAALEVVREISPEEARLLLDAPDRGGWHFVDVREADEWSEGRIPGARHFPRGFLEVRADLEHPKRDAWLADRGRKLVLYCGGGNRSALAARALHEMGFTDVRSLAEGFSGWLRRGFPVER